MQTWLSAPPEQIDGATSHAKTYDLIDETITVWQKYSTRRLTREDGREIVENMTGFFRILQEWDRAERAAISGGGRLFAKQEPHEQRRLLNFVLSNSTWKNGELKPTYRQPFDLIAEATAAAMKGKGDGALNSPEHPVWLGFLDTF